MERRATLLMTAVLALGLGPQSQAASAFETVTEFSVPEANQAVGVDERHFYAIDNQSIAKYDKATRKLVKQWDCLLYTSPSPRDS